MLLTKTLNEGEDFACTNCSASLNEKGREYYMCEEYYSPHYYCASCKEGETAIKDFFDISLKLKVNFEAGVKP